jgi:hypothetical protein
VVEIKDFDVVMTILLNSLLKSHNKIMALEARVNNL